MNLQNLAKQLGPVLQHPNGIKFVKFDLSKIKKNQPATKALDEFTGNDAIRKPDFSIVTRADANRTPHTVIPTKDGFVAAVAKNWDALKGIKRHNVNDYLSQSKPLDIKA